MRAVTDAGGSGVDQVVVVRARTRNARRERKGVVGDKDIVLERSGDARRGTAAGPLRRADAIVATRHRVVDRLRVDAAVVGDEADPAAAGSRAACVGTDGDIVVDARSDAARGTAEQ